MSIRSHPGPERPLRPGPAIDADRAGRCTESVRDIAEDFTVLAEALMHSTYGSAPTTELLHIIMGLENLVQQAIAALVVRQRSQGKPLSDLAPMLNRTEDRLRKKYDPQTVDQTLATRRRPMRATPSTQPPESEVPTAKNLLRRPRQRLACALTLMWTRSGISQRALAERMNVDPSYVSRMLSGERDVSWQHLKIITDTCDGNPDLMKPLWEAAAGVHPAGTEPARYLRTYLRALQYAAGSPNDTTILASAQHTITAAELHRAFNGPGVPDWPVVAQLTTTLQSLPDIARPLWRQARSSCETTISAEAFG
ncbi:helix-turn-helix domain-containing protein [Streptomyces sp. NPDC001933]|uniref:helix-turn-helix domain-containing protein n=1 Tax=Streptomyces sp. NPDC001933 TaxID=3364626 RepID=UPI0036ACB435